MLRLEDATRRTFLRVSALSCLAAAGASGLLTLSPARAQPGVGNPQFIPDLEVQLRAREDHVQILHGEPTRVWRYDGKVLKGDPGSLGFLSNGYLPVLRVRRGQKVKIDLLNELPEPTVIHWHGLYVPAAMDGHPRNAIATGQHYVYEFDVLNRAGTYWFHAHPDGRTGAQIYLGQAGLLIVADEEEAALGLPSGAYDVPLVIQDRVLDGQNQFTYLSDSDGGMMGRGMMGGGGMMGQGMMGGGGMMGRGMMGGDGMGQMMARMMGFLGDRILVNGKPDFVLPVAARAYRLRLLNASNTRIYKLGWSDRSPLAIIGTDGGLLERPVMRPYVTLSPAERVDIWVDFSQRSIGTELTLQSLTFDGEMAMGGMMGNAPLPNGASFPVLKVRVEQRANAKAVLPKRLASLPVALPRDAINARAPKVFNITMGMMVWGINGRSFDMDNVTKTETVRRNSAELWEFRNEKSMMLMAHSMHVHGLQFRVLGRTVLPDFVSAHRTVAAGLVDDGWKDTVLLMPGERIRLLLRFEHYAGMFLYHCHMLEHEDTGLMRNYLIET
ncbi:multicopper oxidase domain-containing protein [Paraburkholderia fungorum]|uniref:Multicopper oxidase CueO n=1 Tax=Paraburkholderia fungorum TaxID=134537 RepID=A0AAP5UXM4_9BURK|nr:multicopper oxidase domain-containing protein [Paraburkholderia fungorum]MDT8840164.1 multicopper oxidase domain-containing protein [Paraburkholderia fungorum]